MEREVETGLREATKAHNMVVHQDEILARPKREWFQTETEKAAVQEKADAKNKKKKQKQKDEKPAKEWIPEEEMVKIRAEARDRQNQKKQAENNKKQRQEERVLEFRDEQDEKRARIVKELAQAGRVSETGRGRTKRALVAQVERSKEEERQKNEHRHQKKEAHKKGFKSLNKYKRRR